MRGHTKIRPRREEAIIKYQRVGGRVACLRQLSKPGSADTVERVAHLWDCFPEHLRLTPCVGQALLPHMDISYQIAQRAPQIIRIFHPGPPSGLGRKSSHPKYLRVTC